MQISLNVLDPSVFGARVCVISSQPPANHPPPFRDHSGYYGKELRTVLQYISLCYSLILQEFAENILANFAHRYFIKVTKDKVLPLGFLH